jgi:hypothetical protein
MKGILAAATIVAFATAVGYWGMSVAAPSGAPHANSAVDGAVVKLDPNWTPAPMGPNEMKAGNCVVPKTAVEAKPAAAASAGGQVFDTSDSRYYSLPNGRCVKLLAAKPFPDWVPPELETGRATPVALSEGGAQ